MASEVVVLVAFDVVREVVVVVVVVRVVERKGRGMLAKAKDEVGRITVKMAAGANRKGFILFLFYKTRLFLLLPNKCEKKVLKSLCFKSQKDSISIDTE